MIPALSVPAQLFCVDLSRYLVSSLSIVYSIRFALNLFVLNPVYLLILSFCYLHSVHFCVVLSVLGFPE